MDYGAAKAGVDNLTVNLSKDLGPKGITVKSVSPGVIWTPPSRSGSKSPPAEWLAR
jgi:3-oxoacyl-[acyl-carrier protein] reductase